MWYSLCQQMCWGPCQNHHHCQYHAGVPFLLSEKDQLTMRKAECETNFAYFSSRLHSTLLRNVTVLLQSIHEHSRTTFPWKKGRTRCYAKSPTVQDITVKKRAGVQDIHDSE